MIRRAVATVAMLVAWMTCAGGAACEHTNMVAKAAGSVGETTLGMSASYSPPGFEQTFKDSLRPNRTQAEIEANRK